MKSNFPRYVELATLLNTNLLLRGPLGFSLKGELLKNSKFNHHPPNDFVHAWACFLHTSMFTLHPHYSIAPISNMALLAAESFWTTKTTWSIIIACPSISLPAISTKIHIFCKQEKRVLGATIWPLTVAIVGRNLNVSKSWRCLQVMPT